MKKIKGNCLIAQSGGPTTVINSSVYGIIKESLSLQSFDKIFIGLYGIKGILDKNIIDIDKFSKDSIEALRYMPSSALGSCRYKLAHYKDNSRDYEKIIQIFKEFNIKYFFYIGGNDSMDAACKISEYVKNIGYDINIIGVPKTIDNDLMGTDHCPGFASTSKYILNTGLELWFDINTYEKESIMIMEVMGRDAGWIAASTGILKETVPNINQLIYLPEMKFDRIKFLQDVKTSIEENNKLLIVTSEGIKGKNGEYINVEENCYSTDAFGHKQLGGIGKFLQTLIKTSITNSVKLTEVGVIQRCAMHIASKTDLDEAEMVGRDSVKYALQDYNGYMTAIKRVEDNVYKSTTTLIELKEVCNKVKHVPLDWINESENGVKKEMINYVSPLISGEVNVLGEDGLLKYRDARLFR
ncbi:6-phosphofructokinase [Clostridium sp. USBA 49]|uniref:6-phosphofructokinase n=1 Tax=Clostridium sp. USBA 49 TaxID=1881060 RepID=UPI00099AB942|nr:6-phosphofructokinase [Clostridium sp. USBA 49]SKA87733.1 6-phosphofructokinase [Clostridium sp. USBA 49]